MAYLQDGVFIDYVVDYDSDYGGGEPKQVPYKDRIWGLQTLNFSSAWKFIESVDDALEWNWSVTKSAVKDWFSSVWKTLVFWWRDLFYEDPRNINMVIPLLTEETWEGLLIETPGDFIRLVWDIIEIIFLRARVALFYYIGRIIFWLECEWDDGRHDNINLYSDF